LILHPQYSGRPSRIQMLQELVDDMRGHDGVWFTHGAELARYALSDAADVGTDGRPRPEAASAGTP
jgi:peptidoglycan-N-acetylglucosamine deacetylase